MPRKPRIDFPGAWHHVMHRGARRERIFTDARHCWLLLDTVGEAVDRFGIEVHAYALMPNHYHFLVRSGDGTLSRAMQYINGRYTQRLNRREGWDGPVFRGRFRSQIVRNDEGLRYVFAYVHLNPVRANHVTRPDAEADCWTSYRAYVRGDAPPGWLHLAPMLDLFGGAAALERFVLSVHRGADVWPVEMDLSTGWFRPQPPAETVEPPPRPVEPRQEGLSVEACLARVTQVTGARRASLLSVERGPRANPARRFAAWALGRSTTLTHAEIGDSLGMSVTAVAKVLARARSGEPSAPLATWRSAWLAEEGR